MTSTSWGGSSSSSGGGSWFEGLGSSDMLPLFDVSSIPSEMPNMPGVPSFSSIKSSMEAQMPQQIMGMSYQQRFKVFCGLLFLSALFFALAFFVGIPTIAVTPRKFALSFVSRSTVWYSGSPFTTIQHTLIAVSAFVHLMSHNLHRQWDRLHSWGALAF